MEKPYTTARKIYYNTRRDQSVPVDDKTRNALYRVMARHNVIGHGQLPGINYRVFKSFRRGKKLFVKREL